MTPEQNPNVDRSGPAIRALREGAGMSVRGLAKAVNVTHSHLLRVESGERVISDELLRKVEEAIAAHLLRKGEAA